MERESIGEVIDKLIKAEIKIAEGYREANESYKEELIKDINEKLKGV